MSGSTSSSPGTTINNVPASQSSLYLGSNNAYPTAFPKPTAASSSNSWSTTLYGTSQLYVPLGLTIGQTFSEERGPSLMNAVNDNIAPRPSSTSTGSTAGILYYISSDSNLALQVPTSLPASATSSLYDGYTLLIPITIPLISGVDYGNLMNAASFALTNTETTVLSGTSSMASSSTSSSATQSNSVNSAKSSSVPTTASSDRATSMNSGSPTPSPVPFSAGDIAGGVVGGLAGGFLVAAMLWFLCVRGRQSKRDKIRGATAISADHERQQPLVMPSEKEHVSVGSEMTGWRKHIPQQKQSNALAQMVHTLFEQAHMHVQAFYGRRTNSPTPEHMIQLHSIATDDWSEALLRTDSAGTCLEAILIRWIVHRISLKSSAEHSLLPPEYTEIPKRCAWHMEEGGNDGPPQAEKGRGLSQASSEWRVLTGFLFADPSSSEEEQQRLSQVIDASVQAFVAAFEPWALPKFKFTQRSKSLRALFEQASHTGIELFKQRASYAFDWRGVESASAPRSAITPALILRMDEDGLPIQPVQTLLKMTLK